MRMKIGPEGAMVVAFSTCGHLLAGDSTHYPTFPPSLTLFLLYFHALSHLNFLYLIIHIITLVMEIHAFPLSLFLSLSLSLSSVACKSPAANIPFCSESTSYAPGMP